MHVLGVRADLVLGAAAEGVLDQLEVVVEVAGTVSVDRGQELGRAVGADELARAVVFFTRTLPGLVGKANVVTRLACPVHPTRIRPSKVVQILFS